MPRGAWQVSTERIFTFSMPASSMALTLASSISSFDWTITSWVNGSSTSSSATRPRMRSLIGSMISPPSMRAPSRMPSMVPQSYSVTANSGYLTRRLVDVAQDAIITEFDCGAQQDAVHGAAVVLGDDRVLRHVHQAAGQVARVGRLERRVRQALASAVGGDEVLQDGEALAEVRRDGRLDDFPGGLRHQAAHAGQLADLLRAAAGARVGHDEDRVEGGLLLLRAALLHGFGPDLCHHLAGHLLGDLRPDVDDLVVALAVGDQALQVLVLDLGHFLLGPLEQLLLALRDHHVLDGDGDARLGSVAVPEAAQPVGEEHRLLLAAGAVADVDQVPQRLLVHHLVDGAEGDLPGQDVREQHAAHRGLHPGPA